MRRHRATGGTHRDAALPSSAVKVGVLGALATATIAAPLAASAAGIDESAAAPDASGLPRTETTTATAATPVALPATEADGEQQQAASADVETRADDAASRDQDRTEPQDDAAGEDGSAQGEDAATGIEVEVPEPEPAPAEPEDGDASGEAGAADASGETPSAGSGGYVQPVSGSISSGYGYRTHPVLGTSKLHEGVDFAVGCGTPVKSAQSGTVVAVEYHSASGKRVKVDHGNGTITGYYHLQGYNTSVGATVEAGEVIGYVGTTGRSTGCHLHFAKMDESGAYSNPMSLLR